MNETLSQLLALLKGIEKAGNNYKAFCPAHLDTIQSLSLKEENGMTLIYCHAGCSFKAIIQSLGLDNFTPKERIIERTYDYTDIKGNLIYQVVRYFPKSFSQRRPDGQGGWIWNLQGITPTLYHLPKVLEAIENRQTIFVVEGEKDVESLEAEGYYATSISGGASTKWAPELIPLFENAIVVIIPDSDPAGRKYAQYVASILDGWCSSLAILNLPIGKDVSDYLETQTIGSLLKLLLTTGEYVPRGSVTREEFESFKGVNLYLWREILTLRGKRRKYNEYI